MLQPVWYQQSIRIHMQLRSSRLLAGSRPPSQPFVGRRCAPRRHTRGGSGSSSGMHGAAAAAGGSAFDATAFDADRLRKDEEARTNMRRQVCDQWRTD